MVGEGDPGMTADVELRHLRSFVAVAEHLNFTRAAQELFIAQQALSAQIQQLEQRLGVQLLVRTTRSVSLTPAGETLHAQARLLLAGAQEAIVATRARAATTTTLTVGFVAAVVHPAVSPSLDAFTSERTDVELRIHFGDLLDPTGGLRSGDVDVAFVYGPFDTAGLHLTRLYDEPVGIGMSCDHPLAAAESVSAVDLVAEPTFDFPTRDRTWRGYWAATAHRNGTPPRFVAQFRTLEGLSTALRAGLGVHLATKGLVDAAGEGVVWRRLDDVACLTHAVARRTGDDRETVRAFIDCVAATFHARADHP